MAALLPPELLAGFLRNLEISDLLKASHTCASWRAIARGCPVFWRDIRLAASSPSATEFFLARLNQTDFAGILVKIDERNMTESEVMGHIVLPALAAQMFRVEEVAWYGLPSEGPSIYQILQQPARCLKSLILDCSQREVLTLPEDLFAGQAPLLREIELHSVMLPSSPVLVLENCTVVHLQRNHSPAHRVPVDLLHFPQVQSLTLDGPFHLRDPSEPPITLHELFLDTTHPRYDVFFEAFAWLLRVAVVAIGEPESRHMLAAVDGLPDGPLHIEVTSSQWTEKQHPVQKNGEYSFSRSYECSVSIIPIESPEYRRTFQTHSGITPKLLQGCLPSLMHRISTMDMMAETADCFFVEEQLPAFTALTTLTLLWSEDQKSAAECILMTTQQDFSALETLRIIPKDEYAQMVCIDCECLGSALRHLLGLTLKESVDILVHLLVEGFYQPPELKSIQDLFASVTFV